MQYTLKYVYLDSFCLELGMYVVQVYMRGARREELFLLQTYLMRERISFVIIIGTATAASDATTAASDATTSASSENFI